MAIIGDVSCELVCALPFHQLESIQQQVLGEDRLSEGSIRVSHTRNGHKMRVADRLVIALKILKRNTRNNHV
jgi:hypothetical protein